MPRGARSLPDACVRWIEQADLVLHAGDFVADEVLEQLRGYGPLEAVHGNMDDEDLRRALPRERVVEVGEARIGLVHDGGPRKGRPARLAARFPDCDAVVYGHTHWPEASRHRRMLILNPGSPTERRRAPRHTMGLVRVGADLASCELVDL
jgi:putative phosphoesterase